MQKLVITGGVALEGEIKASGAKNAALPLLACALLTDEPMTFVNVPDLADVHTMLKLLEELGCKVTQEGHKVTIDASHITSTEAPYDLVKTMRASILVLGPLLARFGKAQVSLPGGCSIGARPVDQHIKGLKALGADISIEHGYVTAHADKLIGTNIVTDMVTVTGTENLLMAAVLAEGTTVLANAAREPEVADLANCLVKMGAKIKGIGSPQMEIEGVKKLHGTTYRVISDRIEVGSFLVAAVMTKGKVRVTDCDPHTLTAVIEKLEEAGAKVTVGDDWIEVDGTGDIRLWISARLRIPDSRPTCRPSSWRSIRQPRVLRTLPKRFLRTALCTYPNCNVWGPISPLTATMQWCAASIFFPEPR